MSKEKGVKVLRLTYRNIRGAVLQLGFFEDSIRKYAKEVIKEDGDRMTFLVVPEAELQERINKCGCRQFDATQFAHYCPRCLFIKRLLKKEEGKVE